MTHIHGTVSTVIINDDTRTAVKYYPVVHSHVYWIREIFILEIIKKIKKTDRALVSFLKPRRYKRKLLRTTDGKMVDYVSINFTKMNKTLSDTFLCDDQTILRAMIDILQAISFCHAHGIWHRDIKAENVLLDHAGRCILIDFSHSIRVKNYGIPILPDYDVVSEGYRAPEIYERGTYDASIDIFAAGMLFAELITGERMYSYFKKNTKELSKIFTGFQAKTEVYIALLFDMYSLKRRNVQDLTFYWSIIVDMISYDPRQRPTAEEVINLLKPKLNAEIKPELNAQSKPDKPELNAQSKPDAPEDKPDHINKDYRMTSEELALLSMCIKITDTFNFKTILNAGSAEKPDTDLRLAEILMLSIIRKIIDINNYELMTVSLSICFIILYEDDVSSFDEMLCAFNQVYLFATTITVDEIVNQIIKLLTRDDNISVLMVE